MSAQAQLAKIVEEAYRAFGKRRLGPALNVCHCNVCLSDTDEAALLTTPLRAISSKLLGKYTNAVSAGTAEERSIEIRYFLPRCFELIAADDPPDDMGLDICLRRLRDFEWRKQWPPEQVECVDRFFDAYLVASLRHTSVWQSGTSYALAFDLGDVLCMIVTAGGDLERALDAWDRASGPSAEIHMAALRSLVRRDPDPRIVNAHLSQEFTGAAHAIGKFLARAEVDARLERTFFSLNHLGLQQLVSDAIWR
jgi:hypothetical protein